MLDEKIALALRGNRDAIAFFLMLRDVSHFWDDMIDRDHEVPPSSVNDAMWKAMVEIPANPFYRANFDRLQPHIVTAIANWQAANLFEAGQDERQLQIAFISRSDYCNILLECAYIIGGRDWLLQMTPIIRDAWTDEDFITYKVNLGNERQARLTSAVRNRYEQETEEYLQHGLAIFNAARLHDNDAEHVRAIINLFDELPRPCVLVDMGAGVGGVGSLVAGDGLHVISVTNVPAQFKRIAQTEWHHALLEDYHHTGLPDACADAVLFNESFGYGQPEQLLSEAERLLKPGGKLLIRDFTWDGASHFDANWLYHFHEAGELSAKAEDHRFVQMKSEPITTNNDAYRAFVGASQMMRNRYGTNIDNGGISWCWLFKRTES